MLGSIILSAFVLVIILFVYIEYKNEKRYQEGRRQKRQHVKKEDTSGQKQRLEEKRFQENKPKPESTPKSVVTEIKTKTPGVDKKPKNIAISLGEYPKFDHSRLLEMGLSQEEAKEFVTELIPQIEAQIPLIKDAMALCDFHGMERLTHSIKGSSTTVGKGGVSDLLIDYNTYLKTGTELAIAEAYFEQLQHYCKELKEQYA